MQSYYIERAGPDRTGPEISRANVRGLNVVFREGNCRADPANSNNPRDIKWYDDNVLKPKIVAGDIMDGSKVGTYDDRKVRYDRTEISGGEVIFYMGHSHFLEMKEKDSRDVAEGQKLVAMGNSHYQNPQAFFPMVPGPTGIVISGDKKLIIGKREGLGDFQMYDGLLQGVGSFFPFYQDVTQIDPISNLRQSLEEKAGVEPERIKEVEFIGLYSNPALFADDLDFAYLVKTDLLSTHFTGEDWKNVANTKRVTHEKWYALDFNELKHLLDTGKVGKEKFDIVFSTVGPLRSAIVADDFK